MKMDDQDVVKKQNLPNKKAIKEIHECIKNANELHFVDPVKGTAFATRAMELSTTGVFKEKNYLQGVADSYAHLAFFNYYTGDIEVALQNAKAGQELYWQLNLLLPHVELYALLGLIYDTIDDRNNAIEHLVRGLDIAKKENFELTEGKIHLLIGIAYYHMDNYRQSLHSISLAYQIFVKYKRFDYLALCLTNMSKNHSLLNQQEKAFECIYESLQIAVDHDYHVIQCEGFFNLGFMHLRNNEYDIAKSHLNYSQRIADQYSLKYFRIKANLGLGQILLNRFETKSALELCKHCLKESEELGIDRLLIETHGLLSEIYEMLHKYKQSLIHFKAFSDLTNKVFNKESQQKTQTIEVLFRTKSAKLEADFTRRKNLSLEKEIVERKKIEDELRKSEKRYQKMASFDPLTKLFNRRHFFNLAEIEFERANRYKHDLAVMMIDLDHFKLINDQYGHLIGDDMLTFVADLCRQNLRKIDVIGRYGGEEFVVLLPQTDKQNALASANRLCDVIAKAYMTTNKGDINTTVSIGVSVNGASIERLEMLFDLADQALYQAKRNGRNQVIMLDNDQTEGTEA